MPESTSQNETGATDNPAQQPQSTHAPRTRRACAAPPALPSCAPRPPSRIPRGPWPEQRAGVESAVSAVAKTQQAHSEPGNQRNRVTGPQQGPPWASRGRARACRQSWRRSCTRLRWALRNSQERDEDVPTTGPQYIEACMKNSNCVVERTQREDVAHADRLAARVRVRLANLQEAKLLVSEQLGMPESHSTRPGAVAGGIPKGQTAAETAQGTLKEHSP